MEFAPGNIMNAVLETVHHATVCARNWTYTDDVPHQAINELMEAIHEMPKMVKHWDRHELDDILKHLNRFDVQKWRTSIDLERHIIPDFAEFFLNQLE